jgi:hypothetical protein
VATAGSASQPALLYREPALAEWRGPVLEDLRQAAVFVVASVNTYCPEYTGYFE